MVMEFHVFTENFGRAGIIDTYISSVWKEHHHKQGSFSIVAGDTPPNLLMLRTGNRVWQRGKRASMIIEYIEAANGRITAHGRSALSRLEDRTITPTINIVNAENGMKDIVRNNMRGLELLNIEESIGLTEEHRSQHTWGEVFETLEEICIATGLGHYMRFDRTFDTYCVYKGSFKSNAVYREDFGNLKDIIYSDDVSVFKNVAYVAGEGEGAARIVEIVGTATGNDRRELYVDARHERRDGETEANYRLRLRNFGVEKLNEWNRKQSFTAFIDPKGFGESVYLGDIVTVISKKHGVILKPVLKAFEEVTENNNSKLKVTFGEPKITIYDELRLRA
jgi:hypothetical protein